MRQFFFVAQFHPLRGGVVMTEYEIVIPEGRDPKEYLDATLEAMWRVYRSDRGRSKSLVIKIRTPILRSTEKLQKGMPPKYLTLIDVTSFRKGGQEELYVHTFDGIGSIHLEGKSVDEDNGPYHVRGTINAVDGNLTLS